MGPMGDPSRHGAPLLLLGPPDAGRARCCLLPRTLAAEEGAGPVIFLSREPLQRLPTGGRAARDPLTLKRIRFLYPSSLKDLLEFFSSLHLTPSFPSLILVDGLERYLPSTCSPQDGARISALMLDTASHFHCGLLVSSLSYSEGNDGAFLAVERYFSNRCHLYSDLSAGTEEREFKISFWPLLEQWTLYMAQDGSLRIGPGYSKQDTSPTRPKAVD
ncbi:ATPase SWSAP1 [Pseudophryne corroboree]|uniref:ATPase SWSAP1 n=1 Tax=Pseudophryne corroboree TaxID=495146 RepID=UPI0030815779